MIFRLGELFCGAGGIGLGAIQSKAQTDKESFEIAHVWATDYEKSACETYRQNLCNGEKDSVICEDIRKLDFEVLAKISPVDALAFGFPCNDFSIVGEQKGLHGEFAPLYRYCIKAVQKFEPMFFVAENVGGLKNANEGRAFNQIMKEFQDCGYKIFPHLYKFEEYGVPQARHRVIIVGLREDLNLNFKIPSPTYQVKTCKEAIEIPPIDKFAPNHEFTAQSKQVVERLKYTKAGENAFTANLPEHLKLNVRGAKISQIYKRLDPTKPSYTVTGSGGGGTHVYHWLENRALTNRERARLQTFPDDFIFYGSKENVRKQIGMAVPPDGAKVIFTAILKTFAKVSYQYIKQNIDISQINFRALQQKLF